MSTTNINKSNRSLIDNGKIKIVLGDGWKGYAQEGPYDCIHVGAAAETVPNALIEQLAPGGRMIIPVGPQGGQQFLVRIDKGEDGMTLTQTNLMGVRYVPLVKA